jgi:hypothetical protein
MATPHPELPLFNDLQDALIQEIVGMLKNEFEYVKLPKEEKEELLRSVAFGVLSAIDSTVVKDKDGNLYDAGLSFYQFDPEKEEDRIRPIANLRNTHMHEVMPLDTDPLFKYEDEENGA